MELILFINDVNGRLPPKYLAVVVVMIHFLFGCSHLSFESI